LKVIVSGSSGNLGQHIISNADFEITTLNRDGWEQHFGGHDVFIHCAYDLKNSITEQPDKVLDSNILSVMRALRLCQENNISKFIFISSCSVYGHSSKSDEEMNVTPASINGLTKLLCENVILEFCRKNEIECTILRVFNSYGGDDQFSVVSKMIKATEGAPFFLCNDGKAERDYVHINDVAKIICHYTKNSSNHKIINVGTGKTTRIKDILKAMQPILGKITVNDIVNTTEVEYSRANNLRLLGDINIEFTDIFKYISELKTIE
jgi:UDP-glucose 4-epimerase